MSEKKAAEKAPTIYDVARVAGVSHQTVSRFLTGTGGIRAANRVRVEAAIEQLNYRTNPTARSLRTKRTHRLGALGYELSGAGPGLTMQGAALAARRAGFTLDIVSLDPVNDDLSVALDDLGSRDLEGILATAPTTEIDAALRAMQFSVPIYIDRGVEYVEDAGEGELPRGGYFAPMRHLAELGHRRIAHLAGPEKWISGKHRRDVYLRSVEYFGLDVVPVVAGDWSSLSGYRAAEALLRPGGITAVWAANDRMALGLLRWLHEHGQVVPDDVSVVGYDDVAEAEFFWPPLTSVRQDFPAIGQAAAESLIALVENDSRQQSIAFPLPELIVRESTAPPAHTSA